MGERFNPFSREIKEKNPEFLYPFRTVQLLGPREAQQDYFTAKTFNNDNGKFQVNIVADGHGTGGEHYAERASKYLLEQIGDHEGEIKDSDLEVLFNDTDVEMSELIEPGGTTLSLVMLDENKIHGAYVGDSDVRLVSKSGMITDLTKPDRLSDPKERERVIKAGGIVMRNRVFAAGKGINITRTIGDHEFKPALTASPHTFKMDIHPADKYLLIASDGFWDAGEGIEIERARLGELLAKARSVDGAQNMIKAYLATRRQVDNVTVQVIELNKKSE